MRVLAFDTATAATAVAIADSAAGLYAEARDDPASGARPNHARKLLALIHEALEAADTAWERIDRIAVGLGPGTFTGMRIGIATGQALAQSTGIPLVGVSTLASLELGAQTALATRHEAPADQARVTPPVLAVIDARRGEAFVAGAGLEPTVLTPATLGDIAGQRASDGITAVGDGAIKFRDILTAAGAEVPPDDSPLHRVSALQHCRLALDAAPVPANTLAPQYLRVPDAELNAKS